MTRYLVWSFRFLAPCFHGRGDEGAPEWPPSPLRAFQAVVAAAGRGGRLDVTRQALTWLEELTPPRIFAPDARPSTVGYRLSVPHNAMDIVGKQWSRGDEGNPAEHRTMKNVRPIALPDDAVVHYAWPIDSQDSMLPSLRAAVRGVVSLGWGVDLVVGDCQILTTSELATLGADLRVWEPRRGGEKELRRMVSGSLEDLDSRHAAFQSRTSFLDPTLRPPPPLTRYEIAEYSRTDLPVPSPVACFTLLRVDAESFRSFDTSRVSMVVSGMLRHAIRVAAERAGWDPERIRKTVLGHGQSQSPRLLMVPVPSIEPRGDGGEVAGAVRRIMILSTGADGADIAWARRALGGMDLIDEKDGRVQAVLSATHGKDTVFKRYLNESTTWVSVTPVVLPGHDDPGRLRLRLRTTKDADEQRHLLSRLHLRREGLIRKALRHAGLGDDLAFSAAIEMRDAGFMAGVELASRFAVPSHLTDSPRVHVKLSWPVPVRGPLCVGRGRFSGMGLLVTSGW